MKRNIDLLRDLLIYLEEHYVAGESLTITEDICGYDLATVSEHFSMLNEEGFIRNIQVWYGSGVVSGMDVENLTSKGFDFLDYIRDEGTWKGYKKEMEKRKVVKTPSAIFSFVKGLVEIVGTGVGAYKKAKDN
ncbi:MAG: DUF2513 domain-containing protein [Firmicutes bacterium]|nr:DUF2513 domain-containing protein [Bacillota bacterium]